MAMHLLSSSSALVYKDGEGSLGRSRRTDRGELEQSDRESKASVIAPESADDEGAYDSDSESEHPVGRTAPGWNWTHTERNIGAVALAPAGSLYAAYGPQHTSSSATSAFRSRSRIREELERESGIAQDALRSSLSTLLMLRPGNELPDFLTTSQTVSETRVTALSSSPTSILTARATNSPASASTSMTATVQPRTRRRPAAHRRRTLTSLLPGSSSSTRRNPTSVSVTSAFDPPDDLASGWNELPRPGSTSSFSSATASHSESTSSFEDVVADKEDQRDEQDLQDMYLEDEREAPSAAVDATPRPRLRQLPVEDAALPPPVQQITQAGLRRRRPRGVPAPPSHNFATSPSVGIAEVQSEPEYAEMPIARRRRATRRHAQGHDAAPSEADQQFLELLEAARMFTSMNRTGSLAVRGVGKTGGTSSSAGSHATLGDTPPASSMITPSPLGARAPSTVASSDRAEGTNLMGGDQGVLTPPSPPAPTSMSTSTTFNLSSNDSPPSRGFASSHGEEDEDSQNEDVGLPVRNSSPARDLQNPLRYANKASDTVSDTPLTEGDGDGGRGEQGWWSWLTRQIRRAAMGIGLIGIGLVVAVGVGLMRKPQGLRRSIAGSNNNTFFSRLTIA